mmetsp:Transcript_309/g.435  ORF Transcript_309/g.435 Transcript_309/m.435 type:complete len:162 (-) Transcript_309:210-695(-)|eukprot:CAMPEP_0113628800 /NCGR_PEP_ID=MMETSP0017_2-20120614/14930_1 /TAXON_ID=2856 /ORGANISM="Cylindrotheca closterium" /LENGTH=161 /DNA_ID=CAMNT_0000539133 /DNA_START=76 /DNA_END=561 /DNA_ORIENTATION=+ /assembly_acc=CAM_ASM_000147
MNAEPSSYWSLVDEQEQKQLATSPATMTLKEANERAATYISGVQRTPKSPSIPIKGREWLSQRQLGGLLQQASTVVEMQDLQDLQFYNRVVTAIKTSTEKQYESKELLEQNEICLENIMRTRSDELCEHYDFEPVSDDYHHHALATNHWESDDEDQFVLDL